MTDTELNEPQLDVEPLAQRIAERGRDALVQRLRTAYADAAAAHADIVTLDQQRIEELVQGAADHADGLQWRRALAGVASEQLGVSVSDALVHPAVARAQALVGAPSYEQSLAQLITKPVTAAGSDNGSRRSALPDPEPPAPEPPDPGPEPSPPTPEPATVVLADPHPGPETAPEPLADELEAVEADDAVFDLLPEPDPIELDTQVYEAAGQYIRDDPLEDDPFRNAPPTVVPPPLTEQELEAPLAGESEDLHVAAVHLGGVANLPTHRDGLDLHLSAHGLDILQGNEILGRLLWSEIDALEVPSLRMRRRRQQNPRARMVVRTPHGDASFEIPGFTSDELRDRVEPLVDQYGRRS